MRFKINDRVTWCDDDGVQQEGTIDLVLSTQYLVSCADGRDRFVIDRNMTCTLVRTKEDERE